MMALVRHRRDFNRFVQPLGFCSAAAMLISMFGGQAYAQAPCTQWDVSGDWTAKQGRFRIKFNLQQTGQNLQGYASLAGGEGSANGPADGQIIGDKFEVTIFWNTIQRSDSIGVYRGQIGPTGRIQGWTQDKTNPGSSAAWHSEERMTCLAREQPSTTSSSSPTVPAKKGKVLGKKKSAEKINPNAADVLTENGDVAGSVNKLNCKSGYVWRVARPEDLVCVTPAARNRVATENQNGPSLVDPQGAFGPLSCIEGYVWRDAFDGDAVCVTPEARDTAKQENQSANANRVGG